MTSTAARLDNALSEAEFSYIAYFDEAGDPGIKRVVPIDNSGGTEWFCVGCVVVQVENLQLPIEYVRRVRSIVNSFQRPDLHYKNLKPWQRLSACTELAKEKVRVFALISNKQSMRGYRNPAAEALSQHPNDYFYNYCIRILLERVTEWVERRSINDYGEPRKIKLVFSKRGGHSYRHVETYTKLLEIQQRNGRLYQSFRSPKFSVLDPSLIYVVQHDQDAGLQMADIVASSFYQAAHARALNWDVGPAKALKPRVASINDRYADKGLQLLPWRSWKTPLTDKQKQIFRFYGYRI